jgi:hypothetical protein
MWMPRKSGAVIIGPVAPKIIQEQKGVELGRVAEPEGAPQSHSGAFDR